MAVLGATSTFAQVYSQNTVGFYTINMSAGFNLIANQMNNGDNTLNAIMPGTTPINDGASLLKWFPAPVNAFQADADIFFAGVGWINLATGEASTTVLAPGEGAFLELTDPAQVVMVGDVPEGTLTRSLVTGQQIISQLTPQALGLEASGFPANDSDTLLFWNTAGSTYTAGYLYFGGAGWLNLDTSAFEDVVPQLGQAMFYNNVGGASTWTRTFDVSP